MEPLSRAHDVVGLRSRATGVAPVLQRPRLPRDASRSGGLGDPGAGTADTIRNAAPDHNPSDVLPRICDGSASLPRDPVPHVQKPSKAEAIGDRVPALKA